MEERLKLVEYSIYKSEDTVNRFEDIYKHLENTDIELKQHIKECHNDIAALTRKTDEKVYEQDRKLQELDSFRKLVEEINSNYDGIEQRMTTSSNKMTSLLERAEHTCIQKNKECLATLRNSLMRVDHVSTSFEGIENEMACIVKRSK